MPSYSVRIKVCYFIVLFYLLTILFIYTFNYLFFFILFTHFTFNYSNFTHAEPGYYVICNNNNKWYYNITIYCIILGSIFLFYIVLNNTYIIYNIIRYEFISVGNIIIIRQTGIINNNCVWHTFLYHFFFIVKRRWRRRRRNIIWRFTIGQLVWVRHNNKNNVVIL